MEVQLQALLTLVLDRGQQSAHAALLPRKHASAYGLMGGWATETLDALFPPQLERGTRNTYTQSY